MSPIKLSLWGPGEGAEESFELDDELVSKLRETVDAHPDFTLGDAFRQGIEHVVDNGPRGGSGPMRPAL
jgi:hypothetical protein